MTIFFKIDWIDFVGHVKYFLDDFLGDHLILVMVLTIDQAMMIRIIHLQALVELELESINMDVGT